MPFAAAPCSRLYHAFRGFEQPPPLCWRGPQELGPRSPSTMVPKPIRTAGWRSARMFTGEKLLRNYGVFPTIGLIGIAICGYISFSLYALATREAWWTRGKEPWDKVDLMDPQPQKLIRIVKEYEPLEELNSILSEMDEAMCRGKDE